MFSTFSGQAQLSVSLRCSHKTHTRFLARSVQRWLEEIAAPGIDCLVVSLRGAVVGFAAVREDEFLHFGIAVERWGTGIAQAAHDAVLDRMRTSGVQRAWMRVFTKNRRGRRFYEKLGWIQTGQPSQSTFPPHAELLRYERDLAESQ